MNRLSVQYFDKIMAQIIIEILKENPVRTVSRDEIKRRWVIKYPQHDRPCYRYSNSKKMTVENGKSARKKISVGTFCTKYTKMSFKNLENLQVIERSHDSVKVVDVSKLVEVATCTPYSEPS